jgi:hypothetical protein
MMGNKYHLYYVLRAYHSVGWGEEITKEFMMYSLDVPVSKKFMKGKLARFLNAKK